MNYIVNKMKKVISNLYLILYISLLTIMFILVFNSSSMADSTALVYKLPVTGQIDNGLYKLVERGITEAEINGADLIVVEIDTYGGYIDPAIKIKDLIFKTEVPIVTFVTGRAWSAGALIALAGQELAMTPGSSMGAAETRPNEEKYISALRKEFKATAESRGKNPDIAAAMVDADIEIEDVIAKEKLLTLTATESIDNNMADYKVINEMELYQKLEVQPGRIIKIKMTLPEKAARIITRPTVTTMLLTVGIIALLAEAVIVGFGVAGTVGMISLGLVFSSYIYYGIASWGLAVLFVVGLILLALEFFVVPGFGVVGIGGIIAIFGSLYFLFPTPEVAILALATVLILSIAGFIVLVKLFGGSRMWQRISLRESQTIDSGYLAQSDKKELTGKTGITITPLRPAGIAEIEGERVDVVSEGGFIDRGEGIIINKIAGNRIIVKKKTKEE